MSTPGSTIGRRKTAAGLTALLAVVAPLVSAAPASGQSLLAQEGLGLPVPPLEARARGLGSIGVGLSGWHLGGGDPSSAAGLAFPAIAVSFQPVQTTFQNGEEAGRARFPVLGVSYPYRGNVFSVRLESFLDQEWEDRSEHVVELEGEEVVVRDNFISSGGISQVRLGWARRLSESVAVGASLGSYVGTVERRFSRTLSGEDVVPGVEPFITQGRWRASGTTVEAGVTWDPSELLRLSAALGWSGDLEVTPAAGRVSEERRYPMPVELRGGGTFTLLPGLGLTLGATFADWSDTSGALAVGGTRGTVWSFGGGVEWTDASFRDRPLPLRFGARHSQLPFLVDGQDASERTYSTGVGWYLAETDVVSLARFEIGLERGSRTAGPYSEDFWRTTISVRLAGS